MLQALALCTSSGSSTTLAKVRSPLPKYPFQAQLVGLGNVSIMPTTTWAPVVVAASSMRSSAVGGRTSSESQKVMRALVARSIPRLRAAPAPPPRRTRTVVLACRRANSAQSR
ncbi:hypothetical protein STENM327S_06228 [Streptomyces tendae]